MTPRVLGLHLPHHDGSPLHLAPHRPAVGDEVEVVVRVPHTYPVRRVHVRSVLDGEPHWAEATEVDRDAHEAWWHADLLVGNEVNSYRFLLDRGDDGYAWLNGTGVHDHEVSDAMDFRVTVHLRAPDWVQDAVIYQVFPDRFARSAAATDPAQTPDWAIPAGWDDPVIERRPDTSVQLYGGDLPGIEEHLDYLVDLGATVLYLTPFFPAASNHRYNATSFDHVDPLLGGDEALASLVKAAHARGLKVIGDLTTNHTGSDHDWFLRAQADPGSPEADFYRFRRHPDDYECWFDEPTLPKLDWRSDDLRRRFVEGTGSIVARYLGAPFHLDGWRVDVANMTGRSGAVDVNAEVAAAIGATVAATGDDRYLLAEHFHDASLDVRRHGWHGVMNYLGFLRPVWTWLRDGGLQLPFLGMPAGVPSVGGDAAVATMREVAAQWPWARLAASAILLGSHDTPRIRTVVGSAPRQTIAAAILATFPGVPLLFMGDELGLEGVDGEVSRTPMPWSRLDDTDQGVRTAYRQLLRLRHDHEALRRGGLRWVAARAEVLAYLRETRDERLLVVAIRDGAEEVTVPRTYAPDEPAVLAGDVRVRADDTTWYVAGNGPTFGVVALPPPRIAASRGDPGAGSRSRQRASLGGGR